MVVRMCFIPQAESLRVYFVIIHSKAFYTKDSDVAFRVRFIPFRGLHHTHAAE